MLIRTIVHAALAKNEFDGCAHIVFIYGFGTDSSYYILRIDDLGRAMDRALALLKKIHKRTLVGWTFPQAVDHCIGKQFPQLEELKTWMD